MFGSARGLASPETATPAAIVIDPMSELSPLAKPPTGESYGSDGTPEESLLDQLAHLHTLG